MSGRTAAARRPCRRNGGVATTDYEFRMTQLEAQMALLLEERYGRATDRERFEELCARAKAIDGKLERAFAFGTDGQIVATTEERTSGGAGAARATYWRPYWLTRDVSEPIAESVFCDLPRQFAKLEQALARDEQTYRETVARLAYANESPVIKLMDGPGFEVRLQAFARKAGGGLELKVWNGKTYAYYYRYKRLKTATVFSSLLTHLPYHTSGKHRYTFWLPVDYVLLRQLLEADAKIYAALPAEMKRAGYP